jgi:hypothetical protein
LSRAAFSGGIEASVSNISVIVFMILLIFRLWMKNS